MCDFCHHAAVKSCVAHKAIDLHVLTSYAVVIEMNPAPSGRGGQSCCCWVQLLQLVTGCCLKALHIFNTTCGSMELYTGSSKAGPDDAAAPASGFSIVHRGAFGDQQYAKTCCCKASQAGTACCNVHREQSQAWQYVSQLCCCRMSGTQVY